MIAGSSSRVSSKCRQVPLWGLAALLLHGAALGATYRPSVAVLPLHNTSIYSGHLLGRRAADQLALELGASAVWRVVDRAQTDGALEQRGLRPPYAVGYIQELGHALKADLLFTGVIQRLDVDKKSGLLKLTVMVEAVDQVSGQQALAVTQTGEARRNDKMPEPTDVLVGRALTEALAEVARRSARSTGILAEVVAPGDGKQVTLKLPAAARVESGFRFLLYRATTEGDQRTAGKLLATVMITRVKGDQAEAQVLARAGDIHTGDLALSVCCQPKTEPPLGP